MSNANIGEAPNVNNTSNVDNVEQLPPELQKVLKNMSPKQRRIYNGSKQKLLILEALLEERKKPFLRRYLYPMKPYKESTEK
ncbi:16926_t:CDS:2 [Funneliformis geosporum]|uniref:10728_t:CDS:1 n=1 Tax=Funneliformis geosporum TaxID=1117311 RepID=A0A9W4T1K1_9GLOM|nr:10728_t:CDS:2 [Funneliformis geosporum]CAI2188889.1 16926_t:CDS:2 [Funneliformis geosporum]